MPLPLPVGGPGSTRLKYERPAAAFDAWRAKGNAKKRQVRKPTGGMHSEPSRPPHHRGRLIRVERGLRVSPPRAGDAVSRARACAAGFAAAGARAERPAAVLGAPKKRLMLVCCLPLRTRCSRPTNFATRSSPKECSSTRKRRRPSRSVFGRLCSCAATAPVFTTEGETKRRRASSWGLQTQSQTATHIDGRRPHGSNRDRR